MTRPDGGESPLHSGASTRDERVRALASALDEERWAGERFRGRIRIVGFHGEDFEQRWPRVQQIVARHNARAVADARRRALEAGWTEPELATLGLGSSRWLSPPMG